MIKQWIWKQKLQTVVCGIHIQEVAGIKRLLVVRSRKDAGEFTEYCYPPWWKSEWGENISETLARELKEELWISAKIGEHFASTWSDMPWQKTEWVFFDFTEKISLNSDELAWFEYLPYNDIALREDIYPLTKTVAYMLHEKYYL